MKYIGFLLVILLSIISCDNSSQPLERNEDGAPVSKSMENKVLIPSEPGGVDFWVDNGCTRPIPKAIVMPQSRPRDYKYVFNKQQGYAKEKMTLDNGYTFDVTSKGCNSIWVTHSYFFPAEDLNITDAKAVSMKVLELLEKTSAFCNPPINIKSKIQPLTMAIDQIGPFNVGEEFLLSDGEIKETFVIDQLQTRAGKVFLQYYFTRGPI